MTSKAITVTVKIGEKEFSKAGSVQVFSADDILTLMQSDPDKVCKTYNTSVEQAERASIRNAIVQDEGAPDRALNKTAKQIFDARKVLNQPVTMDAALNMAKSMLGMSVSA